MYIEAMKRFRQTPEQMEIVAERMKQNAHEIHALFGMETELGELFDIFKRHLIYGEDIDKEHAKEEAGDFLYYFGLLLDVMGISGEDAMLGNYDKLSKRYPGGFSEEAGIARADKNGLPDDKRKESICTGCCFIYNGDGEDRCRCVNDGTDTFGKNYGELCEDILHICIDKKYLK